MLSWVLCGVQARVDAEKARLAATRVSETSELAVAAAAVSGQQLQRSITLQELLRRPHIHHRYGLMSVQLVGSYAWGSA